MNLIPTVEGHWIIVMLCIATFTVVLPKEDITHKNALLLNSTFNNKKSAGQNLLKGNRRIELAHNAAYCTLQKAQVM